MHKKIFKTKQKLDLIKLSSVFFKKIIKQDIYKWGVPRSKKIFIYNLTFKNLYRFYRFRLNLSLNFFLSLFYSNNFNIQKKFLNKPVLITCEFPNKSFTYKKIYQKYFGKYKSPDHIYLEVMPDFIRLFYVESLKKELITHINIKNLFFINYFFTIKTFFLRLIPFKWKKYQYEIIINLYYLIFKKIKPNFIIYPFEGQLWEKAINIAGEKLNIKRIGVIHALNITNPENKKIIFNKQISPNILIALNKYQKNFLSQNMGWHKNQIFIRDIKYNKPSKNIMLANEKLTINMKSKNILIIGSYFIHEDLASFEITKKILSRNHNMNIFYKPHPTLPEENKKKVKSKFSNELRFHIIESIQNKEFNIIISPLSSSSSIELIFSRCKRLLIYENSEYITPNIFKQFNLNIKPINENSSIVDIKKFLEYNPKLNYKIAGTKPLILNNKFFDK